MVVVGGGGGVIFPSEKHLEICKSLPPDSYRVVCGHEEGEDKSLLQKQQQPKTKGTKKQKSSLYTYNSGMGGGGGGRGGIYSFRRAP